MSLTDEMRAAADTLVRVADLMGYRSPDTATFTARRLRYEAEVLDRPITGDDIA